MDEAQYFDDSFSVLAEKLLAQYHVPSISIAIVDNGKTYSRAYGLARFPSTPATPDTIYFTGSTTKAMLAAAIGVLIKNPDKIKLEPKPKEPISWQTSLRSILGDDFTVDDPYISENATIEDALTHRTGLSGHEMFYGPYIGDKLRDVTKRIRHLGPPNQQFRTTMQYNNYMYAVAGDVLETLAGMNCSDAMRHLLWKPLGMNNTSWHLQEVVDASHIDKDQHMSRGYHWVRKSDTSTETSTPTQGYYIPDRFLDFAGVAPAGSVSSTVLDYAKWIEALLDAASTSPDKENTSSSPISPALFAELSTPRIAPPSGFPKNPQLAPSPYALGWMLSPTSLGSQHPSLAHSGGLTGYGAMVRLLPNDNLGIVTLGNTSLTSNLVGNLLIEEAIIRKIGLRSRGREQELKEFKIATKAELIGVEHCIDQQLGEHDSDETKEMMRNSETRAGRDISVDDFLYPDNDKNQDVADLRRYQGVYTHAAYGQFRVTFAPAPASESEVKGRFGTDNRMYRYVSNKSVNSIKEKVHHECHQLLVEPVGPRTWSDKYILYPRVVDLKSISKSDGTSAQEEASTSSTDPQTTWFDQEWINTHGNTEDDVAKGIPTGAEPEVASDTCRAEKCLVSLLWTRLGAAFVESSKVNVDNGGENSMKMGLTLANSHIVTDGTKETGWEKRMVWFEKVE